MHLNSWPDGSNPPGFDVSVQRMSVYVQRNLGPPGQVSPDQDVKNPYKHAPNGHWAKGDSDKVDLEWLDNSNTVIIFETSASMLMEDCLIQASDAGRDLPPRILPINNRNLWILLTYTVHYGSLVTTSRNAGVDCRSTSGGKMSSMMHD